MLQQKEDLNIFILQNILMLSSFLYSLHYFLDSVKCCVPDVYFGPSCCLWAENWLDSAVFGFGFFLSNKSGIKMDKL